MSRYYSYINTAKEILSNYKGEEPLVIFLKIFFSGDKKYGSTDRRQISHLCYCYFRLGKAFRELSLEEKILTGLFLCVHSSNKILQQLRPEWNEKAGSMMEEKFSLLTVEESRLPVFPWKELLSEGIDHTEFSRSFFIQPDLFLRLRPGYEETVKVKLREGGIEFRVVDDNCLALYNSLKVDGMIELDKEAVVQDLSSQRTIRFFVLVRPPGQTESSDGVVRQGGQTEWSDGVVRQEGQTEWSDGVVRQEGQTESSDGTVRRGGQTKWSDGVVRRGGQTGWSGGVVRQDGLTARSDRVWDCCAGSGGKSIMLYDHDPDIELTVSDTRKTILVNLAKRFKKAGIHNYQSFTADLSKPAPLKFSTFSFIIADVPCTGSGTWGRTPEQLYYFEEKKITAYAAIQQQIVSTVIPHLETEGHLLYITCSVFEEENEKIVEFIRENFHLEIVKMELLKGYPEKADTLFAALLKKVL